MKCEICSSKSKRRLCNTCGEAIRRVYVATQQVINVCGHCGKQCTVKCGCTNAQYYGERVQSKTVGSMLK